jgi:hypothetical protein
MNLRVEIRRNSDGALAVDTWPDWDFNEYWWSDGNASCDCNRELFFQHARGEPESDEPDCGDGGYSVRLSDADTGAILYADYAYTTPRGPQE